MTTLCGLLHFCDMAQTTETAAYNESPMLLNFAVAVDKYDVVGALRLQSQAMLMSWIERVKVEFITFGDWKSLGQLMAAAYLLGQPKAFGQLTLLWVNAKMSRPSRLFAEPSGQIIPTKVLRQSCLQTRGSKMVLTRNPQSLWKSGEAQTPPGGKAFVLPASAPTPTSSRNAPSTASPIKQ